MRWVWRIFFLAAVVALVVWLRAIFFPSEEKAIRKHLTETARAASFPAHEGSLARLGNIAQLAGCFSPDVELSFDAPREGHVTVHGRDEIMGLANRVRDVPGGVKVEFPDVVVTVNPDHLSATANITVKAQQGGVSDSSIQEMKVLLKKIKGRWIITRVETVKTLSRRHPPADSIATS
ncbi:MAG: hypothetical protein EXS35_17440 [Pedosphaera sp.]|nr:hypothetical protein [Pedosphaera sp.]